MAFFISSIFFETQYPKKYTDDFFVGNISIEERVLLTDIFNIQALNIEFVTDFNFLAIIQDKQKNKILNAECMLIEPHWTEKGTWKPADPTPTNPNNGDFYIISENGNSDITGDNITFTSSDLLLFDNNKWNIESRKHAFTDNNGIANLHIVYSKNKLLVVRKAGWQTELQHVYYISGKHEYYLTLIPTQSVIFTKQGYALNLNPTNKENKIFS